MRKFIFLILPIVALLMLTGIAGTHAQERPEVRRNIVFTAFFEDVDEPQSRISLGIRHKTDPKVISRYTEKKNQTGVYSRTQYNVLLCEASPCEQRWSASFVYTDEDGKKDTFVLTWIQTIFEGITPKGTSKRELLYCLNGDCKSLENTANAEARCLQLTPDNHCKSYESTEDFDTPQTATMGRYH
ncbi:MAG TPA: hypothetical protein VLN91_01210, partial [Nitrospirota bacterium]|nr:hypothetical protein [Nitrospirota bacterium]